MASKQHRTSILAGVLFEELTAVRLYILRSIRDPGVPFRRLSVAYISIFLSYISIQVYPNIIKEIRDVCKIYLYLVYKSLYNILHISPPMTRVYTKYSRIIS